MSSISILFFKCLVFLFLLLGPSVGQGLQAPGMAPQPFADQPIADQGMAPQSFANQRAADQGQAPQPFADQPTTDQGQAPQPFADQPTADQGQAPQPFADQPAADQGQAPQPFADQPAADQGQAPAQVEPPAVQPAPSNNLPPRTFVAVQGAVFCKPCQYQGFETLLGASPLPGAIVSLVCSNTKYPVTQSAKTDKNGYFFLQAPKSVTNYGAQKCRVFLVSSPSTACEQHTNIHSGHNGAVLRYEKGPDHPTNPFTVYTVGPFAFEPIPADCRRP